ncbi:hypothetical protein [Candidatus Nitrosotenuis uzonensis]|uniref:Late embryogenesis abundant protein LEA-2 subgroup domain-containing protein n=1 Tax=Candidatus Nitrosotenuis uzonensis TaxID=1407055 RepID=V6AVQ7_9ARCH|nr:hypothetical protein [Candidatus Nitrosotenuis uzonensis]CDI06671.1 conserved exported hypothetical protein [Candidatus Nitrosotenuis uzonensis]
MRKKIIIAIIVVVVIIGFGYSQYASALQINAKIVESKLLEKTERGSLYNLELEFNNPSLLVLNAGKTEFTIEANEKLLGGGDLDPFLLPALGKATTSGTFLREQQADDNSKVKISGVTKYQLLFASIDIPFTYYPTYEQTRGFIQDS